MMQEKQIRQLLLEEYGSLYKAGVGTNIALVFPNSYYLGMSSLGFQVILAEINNHSDASCERAFLSLDAHGSVSNERIRTLETNRLLSDFDIIGFSISFELDYINLVKILNLANITLRAKERGNKEPLIIAGGISPSFNPEPIADFVDAFVIGDGEKVINKLISEYQEWRNEENANRIDLYNKLSKIEGVYVPSLYDVYYGNDGKFTGIYAKNGLEPVIKRHSINNLDDYDTTSKILTPNTEFANTFLLEVARGCPHRCKFCVASHVQKCRFRAKEAILKLSQSELAKKADKIGLLGSSVSDHPQIDEIAAYIIDNGGKISVASLRADSISYGLLDALAASDQRTITLAPETASENLRKIIGKDILIDATLDVIKSAIKRGIINIKLYFMIGLPFETQEDVKSIVNLVENVKKIAYESNRPIASMLPQITVSVSPFVPKPHTPFQWLQMEDAKVLSKKLQFLKKELGQIGGVRFTASSAKWSAVQGVLARGDRRLANVLSDFVEKSLSWNQALKLNVLTQEFYLQKREDDEVLSWDHIDLGTSKSFLLSKFK